MAEKTTITVKIDQQAWGFFLETWERVSADLPPDDRRHVEFNIVGPINAALVVAGRSPTTESETSDG